MLSKFSELFVEKSKLPSFLVAFLSLLVKFQKLGKLGKSKKSKFSKLLAKLFL